MQCESGRMWSKGCDFMVVIIPHDCSPRYNYQEKVYIPTQSDCEKAILVIDTVIELFEKYFQKSVAQFALWNSLTFTVPQTLRNAYEIHLCCDNSIFYQLVYQLSHELCHWMIPSDVANSFRWFEESICEVASFFFLDALSHCWPSSVAQNYEPLLISYLDLQRKKEKSINIVELLDSESDISNHLKSNCYDRPVNAFIANQMLPIFQEHSAAWKTVPYLCELEENMSLEDALSALIDLSDDEARPGWELIKKVFVQD